MVIGKIRFDQPSGLSWKTWKNARLGLTNHEISDTIHIWKTTTKNDFGLALTVLICQKVGRILCISPLGKKRINTNANIFQNCWDTAIIWLLFTKILRKSPKKCLIGLDKTRIVWYNTHMKQSESGTFGLGLRATVHAGRSGTPKIFHGTKIFDNTIYGVGGKYPADDLFNWFDRQWTDWDSIF